MFGCTKSAYVYGPFAAVGNPKGRPVGAPCAFDDQCGTNRCSADIFTGTCGQCVTIVALGQDCTGPHQGCSKSAVCQDGICKSKRKLEGDDCGLQPKGGGDAGDCDVELYCARMGDYSTPGKCTRRRPPGASCEDDRHACALGTLCHGTKGCVAPVPGSCDGPYSCGRQNYCGDDHRCHPGTLPINAQCGFVHGHYIPNACGPGLVCGNVGHSHGPGVDATCLPRPDKGEPCINFECAEGLVCSHTKDGAPLICASPNGEGAECGIYDNRGPCAAGLECRANRCRAACE